MGSGGGGTAEMGLLPPPFSPCLDEAERGGRTQGSKGMRKGLGSGGERKGVGAAVIFMLKRDNY